MGVIRRELAWRYRHTSSLGQVDHRSSLATDHQAMQVAFNLDQGRPAQAREHLEHLLRTLTWLEQVEGCEGCEPLDHPCERHLLREAG
jgi:hypothetical protein